MVKIEREQYQPTPQDMNKAQEAMTHGQRKSTELKERFERATFKGHEFKEEYFGYEVMGGKEISFHSIIVIDGNKIEIRGSVFRMINNDFFNAGDRRVPIEEMNLENNLWLVRKSEENSYTTLYCGLTSCEVNGVSVGSDKGKDLFKKFWIDRGNVADLEDELHKAEKIAVNDLKEMKEEDERKRSRDEVEKIVDGLLEI